MNSWGERTLLISYERAGVGLTDKLVGREGRGRERRMEKRGEREGGAEERKGGDVVSQLPISP